MATRARPLLMSDHPRPTQAAVRDLAFVVLGVWLAAFVVHRFQLPEALAAWNQANQAWAIDEVTMVSLCAVAGLGVFSWRRWQESLRIIARHESTLERLRTTESEVASKDRLIRAVSHELRTPLTAMLGYAELLGEEGEVGDRREMVATIVRQGRDLSDIVEDLITRAQSEARLLRVVEVPVRLTANTAQVLETWAPDERRQITVTGEAPVAVGDPARVRQIIRNLLTNALRYGAAPFLVEAGGEPGRAWVRVVDHGTGVPEGDGESIFEAYRGVDDTRVPGSLGLGLTISRELARLMGGDLTYRREAGRTVFELSLRTVT